TPFIAFALFGVFYCPHNTPQTDQKLPCPVPHPSDHPGPRKKLSQKPGKTALRKVSGKPGTILTAKTRNVTKITLPIYRSINTFKDRISHPGFVRKRIIRSQNRNGENRMPHLDKKFRSAVTDQRKNYTQKKVIHF
ncbi:hypothetical protein, partial [Succinimonas sp.]|uniref:hypothetical protein n=1 Tax=Succinimonas sp. TaxID=1936151 RepID=UPI00386FF9B6